MTPPAPPREPSVLPYLLLAVALWCVGVVLLGGVVYAAIRLVGLVAG